MRLHQTEKSGFDGQGKELTLTLPSPKEVIAELMRTLEPGQELTGVRVVGGKEESYKPAKEMVDSGREQVLRRFELRRHSDKVFTLAIEQNIREHRAAGLSLSGLYTHVNVDEPLYDGSYLLLGDEIVSVKSGITDSAVSDPHKEFKLHNTWDDLEPSDITALETIRDDILTGETEMRVADIRTKWSFGVH